MARHQRLWALGVALAGAAALIPATSGAAAVLGPTGGGALALTGTTSGTPAVFGTCAPASMAASGTSSIALQAGAVDYAGSVTATMSTSSDCASLSGSAGSMGLELDGAATAVTPALTCSFGPPHGYAGGFMLEAGVLYADVTGACTQGSATQAVELLVAGTVAPAGGGLTVGSTPIIVGASLAVAPPF